MRFAFFSLLVVAACAASFDSPSAGAAGSRSRIHALQSSVTAPGQKAAAAATLAAAIGRGELAWELSEPDEVRPVLGAPLTDETRRDGGLEVRRWAYAGQFAVFFVRQYGANAPFVLARAQDGERTIGAAPGARLMLRTPADLAKLRPFTGLQNADASKLDLRDKEEQLRAMTFDTRTVWPAADRLPKGFDPAALLRDGKNPGLGLRALHARGIDGRGVTIGIIDQPLLPDHLELAGGRLHLLAELDVQGVPAQMHGPAVSSLAAGRSVGVAPGARVEYVSMAMWKATQDNHLYIDALERMLAFNRQHDATDRIRAVSISYGGFNDAARADEWTALVGRAEQEGLLVITCDLQGTQLDYGLLKPLPGGDREKPEGYGKGSYGRGLLVPGDGRTFAHNESNADYVYAPQGGMSWGAPYLAGLAALGLQVNPLLTPARVRAYLARAATRTSFGDIVNPEAFVRMCREDPDGK